MTPGQDMDNDTTRLHFPGHEARLPWLAWLFDALAVIDQSVGQALAAVGRVPACQIGCCNCCRNQLIPVTPLEIAGMAWYADTQLDDTLRSVLARQLRRKRHAGCRFLLERRCVVYPVRPVACRRFVVFGRPCAPEEDVWITRRSDVLIPSQETKLAADRLMLPYYGLIDAAAQEAALHEEFLRRASQLLFACDFTSLAHRLAGPRAA